MLRQVSLAGTALVGLLLVTVVHHIGSANTPLKRMREAARQVKSVHLIGWNCELSPDVTEDVLRGETQISATRVLPHRFEAWVKNGRWRESLDADVTVYSTGKVWKNGVLVPGENQPPLLTEFAVRAITGEEPFGDGVKFDTQVLGQTVLDGRPALKFVVESRKQPGSAAPAPIQERRLFWLDPVTNLPIRMEQMRYNIDRWELDAVVWFDYDQPVPDVLFDTQKIRTEPHGQVDYTKPSAQALYHFTNDQYARYTAILSAEGADRDRINAMVNVTKEQKDVLQVKSGANCNLQLRAIMTPDQQKLFDDWWYVQPKVMEKLLTPQRRKEDAQWHAEQKALMAQWFDSQDAATQRRLGLPLLLRDGN